MASEPDTRPIAAAVGLCVRGISLRTLERLCVEHYLERTSR